VKATAKRPYRSGFCRHGADAESHSRCRGVFGNVTCSCEHHTAPVVPAQAAAPALEQLPPKVDASDPLAHGVDDCSRAYARWLSRPDWVDHLYDGLHEVEGS
jgi:hypothetical protein